MSSEDQQQEQEQTTTPTLTVIPETVISEPKADEPETKPVEEEKVEAATTPMEEIKAEEATSTTPAAEETPAEEETKEASEIKSVKTTVETITMKVKLVKIPPKMDKDQFLNLLKQNNVIDDSEHVRMMEDGKLHQFLGRIHSMMEDEKDTPFVLADYLPAAETGTDETNAVAVVDDIKEIACDIKEELIGRRFKKQKVMMDVSGYNKESLGQVTAVLGEKNWKVELNEEGQTLTVSPLN